MDYTLQRQSKSKIKQTGEMHYCVTWLYTLFFYSNVKG